LHGAHDVGAGASDRGATRVEPIDLDRHLMGARVEGRMPTRPAIDPAIVVRAKHGDLDAFEEVVRARMEAIYRLSFAILGDESEARDAAQETFVAAWQRLSGLRDPERLDAWLDRIAVNAARMNLRARRRRRVREIPVADVGRTAAATATAPARDDAAMLAGALRHLPVEQRELLALHHLEGRPLTEIADVLDVPVGTVKSRLSAARAALGRALADEDRA
jgi:RNA polymerase sigma factor (sigma-70 family)